MTISELNKQLTNNLKAFIKSEGFYSTGKLYNSVKFKCTFSNNDLKMKFSALEYIHYLDDGKLVNNFFELESTNQILEQFLAINIVIDVDIT